MTICYHLFHTTPKERILLSMTLRGWSMRPMKKSPICPMSPSSLYLLLCCKFQWEVLHLLSNTIFTFVFCPFQPTLPTFFSTHFFFYAYSPYVSSHSWLQTKKNDMIGEDYYWTGCQSTGTHDHQNSPFFILCWSPFLLLSSPVEELDLLHPKHMEMTASCTPLDIWMFCQSTTANLGQFTSLASLAITKASIKGFSFITVRLVAPSVIGRHFCSYFWSIFDPTSSLSLPHLSPYVYLSYVSLFYVSFTLTNRQQEHNSIVLPVTDKTQSTWLPTSQNSPVLLPQPDLALELSLLWLFGTSLEQT